MPTTYIPKGITQQNFVAEFQRGNESALAYIYDHYSAALYGVLMKMCGSEELCQDLLQEAFVKIWRNRQKFDSDKGSIYTWMLNLTRNNCIDYLRSKQNKSNQKNQALDSVVYGLKGGDTFSPSHIGLRELLSELPPEQKEIIELSYFSGYTQQEISEERNIPLGTVKSRAKAALQKLRSIFKSNEDSN